MDFLILRFKESTHVLSLSVTQLHGDMSASWSVNPVVVCRTT